MDLLEKVRPGVGRHRRYTSKYIYRHARSDDWRLLLGWADGVRRCAAFIVFFFPFYPCFFVLRMVSFVSKALPLAARVVYIYFSIN